MDQVLEHIKTYFKFYSNNKLLKLAININEMIPNEYVDGIVSSNKSRILMDSKFYSNLNKPLYMPKDLTQIYLINII